MRVLAVFNNNVVLARDDAGRDVILTGRGLGFQARPGQEVDPSRVVRTFVPEDGHEPTQLAQLLASIPEEHVALVVEALDHAGLDHPIASNPASIVALADHIGFALERVRQGTVVDYPLLAEVRMLYAEEYAQASVVLAAINRSFGVELPQSEAVAIALHLVNASFAVGDLSYTYTMTALIRQLLDVIAVEFGIELDSSSVSVDRFITHLRHLVVRIHQHQQLDQQLSSVGTTILETFPRAAQCTQRLASVLQLRLGARLTEDEISYLTLHVARVTAEPGPVA